MKLINDLKSTNTSLYIACTGGGSGLQDILWKEPGASSFLVGASFPYSTTEFDSFIGYQKKNKYCSREGAIEFAMASYIRAREYCILNNKDNPVGIGISCACTTNRDKKGANRVHTAWVNKFGISSAFVEFNTSIREADGEFVNQIGLATIADAIGKEYTFKINGFDLSGNITFHNITTSERYVRLLMKEFAPQQACELFFQYPYFCNDGTKSNPLFTSVIFLPGSFNPIHDGHRDIAWKTSCLTKQNPTYMITSDSIHKKSLTVSEMLDRVAMVRLERYGIYKCPNLLFTQEDPLFIDKAKNNPGCSFVIGYDTAERMLDPKWGPEIILMLHEFRKYRTKFYICGRIINEELKTIKDLSYPSYFSDLLIEVPNTGTEHSSTQIRK